MYCIYTAPPKNVVPPTKTDDTYSVLPTTHTPTALQTTPHNSGGVIPQPKQQQQQQQVTYIGLPISANPEAKRDSNRTLSHRPDDEVPGYVLLDPPTQYTNIPTTDGLPPRPSLK